MTRSNGGPVEVGLAGGALGFNWLPVFVAERFGVFEKHGIRAHLKRMGSVDKATGAVESGEAHLAITPPEGAIASCAKGGGLRIVAGNVNRLPLTLIANPRFATIEQLKGATLGTSSLTEGTAIYTREMLARHGLRYPGDYEFAVVGVHPARWKALQEGTIDAAVQLIPLNFVAIDAGYRNLGEVSDYIPEIVFTAFVGDKVWLNENRSTAIKVLEAVREATDHLHDPANDKAVLPIVMEITQSDLRYAERSLIYMREKAVFARHLEIPEAALGMSLELMVRAQLLGADDKVRAREAFDASIVAELQ